MGSIIPVGLLDLHPLPPSTNLLFHIIGRFERVVEWLEGDSRAERRSAAWQFQGAEGELKSRTRWQSLLRAVAAGWDGNAKARWSRLDLEAYTLELEETERQRLNLVDTFAGFIDALASDFQSWRLGGGRPGQVVRDERDPAGDVLDRRRAGDHNKEKAPLFVLAVDDADMNPERSVELLDTVRMLWHPRVAFILTGDSELFVLGLIEHCLRQLRKPLRKQLDEGGDAVDAPAIRQLANDIYDKVIPVGHRCTIPSIPRSARLNCLPDLHETLEKIHAEPGGRGAPRPPARVDRSAREMSPGAHSRSGR
jgi:hypothetical protein